MAVYDKNGNRIDEGSDTLNLDYDAIVISCNHRGYSAVAPENTLPAYRLSKKMGFNWVETDVSFTSDGVPMLLHDATIDRTSNGTGTLSDMTYDQVRQYDFGSWKSSVYAGTVIPTLEEFLALCRAIMLYPYIELKDNGGYTEAQIQQVVDLVNKYGMRGKCAYISFSSTYLTYVKNYDPYATLGFLKSTASASDITTTCANLQTGTNLVFFAPKYTAITTSIVNTAATAKIPIRTWTINDASTMLGLDPYVTGITSDNLIGGKVLYDANIDD